MVSALETKYQAVIRPELIVLGYYQGSLGALASVSRIAVLSCLFFSCDFQSWTVLNEGKKIVYLNK